MRATHTTIQKPTLGIATIIGCVLFIVASIIAGTIYSQRQAGASNLTDGFKAGKIIDDAVFTNHKSMSAGQIQSFLESKVATCHTNGVHPIPQWVYDYGNKPPFTCLKDYVQNGKKASQIIYDVSQKYRINPQVFLVLLQKEQSLVTDTWPVNNPQYKSATGYGCPDNAPCDSAYYGLTNQLDWAGKMFRSIMDNVPQSQWYTPYVLGNNYIQYNPSASCGGSVVNIENRATQALYNYTPYQPNQAALNAGWGTASCGAYGNRNFYMYFKAWFGDPTSQPTYRWSQVSAKLYVDSDRTTELTGNNEVEPGQKVYAQVKAKNTGNQVWYRQFMKLATTNPRDRSSKLYDTSWVGNNRATHMSEAEVQPGETATFNATFKAPSAAGTIKERFSLVNEGISWLNDPGMSFTINVTPSRTTSLYSDTARTKKIGSTNGKVYPGDKIYATVTVKNNTGTTLPANTRIATTNPNDRLSKFRDSSWISSNRLVELGQAVAVGETATFKFTLQAPSEIGTYDESFGLVIDGAGGRWIEDDTSGMKLSVVERPSDQLSSNKQLQPWEELKSPNGTYRLTMQGDGNLVLRSGNRAIWASNTVGRGGNRLVMQGDGNLVLYAGNRAVWASNTVNRGGNRLVMQNDGNLVMYSSSRAVWATNTVGR